MVAGEKVKTVAVDFDGVIHAYRKGWLDGTIYDEPVQGAIDGIRALQREYAVYVHTSRDPHTVAAWLNMLGVPALTMPEWVAGHPEDDPWGFWAYQSLVLVTGHKLPAIAYLDDRAVPFMGWLAVPAQIRSIDRFKGTPPSLAVARHEDWKALEQGEVVARILEGCPGSWDDDVAPGSIVMEYVREMERRLDAAGISRERHVEPEGHIIELRGDGWTVQHPLSCRPDLFACALNRAALSTTYRGVTGRFRCELGGDGGLVIGEEIDGQ